MEVLGDGSAAQYTHDDRRFDYPADEFTTGAHGGRAVPCINAALQWTFHHGYQPAPKDLHDLALLEDLISH